MAPYDTSYAGIRGVLEKQRLFSQAFTNRVAWQIRPKNSIKNKQNNITCMIVSCEDDF